jgi:predicted RNase H-like HicB family nuclease
VIRTYSLIIEGDGAGYSAYVPELPAIVVTGNSIEDLTARAKEAIQLYWEALHADRSPGATAREIEVELPVWGDRLQ